jgi:hypothetical protein
MSFELKGGADNRKLSDQEVRAIRASRKGCTELARVYRVSKSVIWNVKNWRTYLTVE